MSADKGLEAMGRVLAGMLPHDVVPRCPRDGGRLLMSVTVYARVPVTMTVFPTGGIKRVVATDAIRETMRELRAQVADEYGTVDEREELHCEKCDYWIDAVELEAGMPGHGDIAEAR